MIIRCLVVWMALASAAMACTCVAPPPPCAYVGTVPVFVAVAESTTADAFVSAKMRVLERFQGNPPDTFEGASDEMCNGPFLEAGHTYLLYQAADFTKTVGVSGCGRSRDAKYAEEELAFWRAYAQGKTDTTISGKIDQSLEHNSTREESEEFRPVRDASVLIQGKDKTYRTTTNALGEYRISNAQPGEYTITPTLEGHRYVRYGGEKLSLSAGGCIVRDFTMQVDRAVRGIVRDVTGAPAADVIIQLVLSDPKAAEESQQLLMTTTEADGSFSLEGIWRGSYYLGVNIDRVPSPKFPHPPTYYPGTTEQRLALPVVFTQGPRTYELNFSLPEPLPLVKMRGRIVREDGTPAGERGGAWFLVREPQGFSQVDTPHQVAVDGAFEVELAEGVAYSIQAYANNSRSESERLVFTATKESALLLLKLRPTEGSKK